MIDKIIIKAVEFDGFDVEYKIHTTHEKNWQITKLKLLAEQKKIIDKLKEYKKAGLIKSIHYPLNKKMKNHLNELIQAKRQIKRDIEAINQFFR